MTPCRHARHVRATPSKSSFQQHVYLRPRDLGVERVPEHSSTYLFVLMIKLRVLIFAPVTIQLGQSVLITTPH